MEGQEEKTTVISGILAIIAIIVIIGIVVIFYHNDAELNRRQICRDSVLAASLSNTAGLDLSSEIKCPTDYKKPIKGTDEQMKREIAEDMRGCWWQFWEGDKELFKEPKVYCVICSVTSFDDKNEKVRGFSRYLTETKMSADQRTYIEYLQKFSTEKADEVIGKLDMKILENDEIDTSKKYATVFVYAKGKDEIEKVRKHIFGETTAGKIGGISAGIAGVGAGIAAVFVVGLASNPLGWVVGAGIAAFGAVEYISYTLSPDNAPERISIVNFGEYSSENLKDLGCAELPAG